MKQELTYWVTLALIPHMWNRRKNEIYVKCYQHEPRLSIIDLFEDRTTWDIVGLTDEEKAMIDGARAGLANNSFLVEELLAQGYDILPITHEDYPKLLKTNLKMGAPVVIYTKGNKALLNEPSIAIVGSRNADATSLEFTDAIARKAVGDGRVVVSGFAKGVDRQALDSAVEAGGKSIIVLPQGIMTFAGGFKQYFKHLAQGRVLVMSVFAPHAPWSTQFAMARNPIIYGMAAEIYVAQSNDSGGTWQGVIDGLRKQRSIYVRYPEASEKSANMQLIQRGAQAVDMAGNVLTLSDEERMTPEQRERRRIDAAVMAIFNEVDAITPRDLANRLGLEWSDDKMKRYLDALQQIEKFKQKNRIHYRLKGKTTQGLFAAEM